MLFYIEIIYIVTSETSERKNFFFVPIREILYKHRAERNTDKVRRRYIMLA